MGVTQLIGNQAESAAAEQLERAGLVILTRNYRVKSGEIDIVARDGDTLVFIEVRKRRNDHYGGAGASIDWRKRERLVRAAQHYLLHLHPTPPCRFDAILVTGTNSEWIRDAF